MAIKLATWNIAWFGKLLDGHTRTLRSRRVTAAAGKALQELQRLQIAEEIRLVDPDILCLQEGPSTGKVALLQDFCERELDGAYTVITRPAGQSYHVLGHQGIWFLVRTPRLPEFVPALLPIPRWREATEFESRPVPGLPGEHGAKWPVRHPWFKAELPTSAEIGPGDAAASDIPAPALAPREHFHFRHPQTLVCQISGRRVDFVGLHLKSKFGGNDYAAAAAARLKPEPTVADRELIERAERLAVEARIKLTTEAVDVRFFIENRFRNEEHPVIFLLGDLNDGVGKEYFERLYLFHDLLTNLQGDVFFSRRFFNHALFDYGIGSDENFRWTAWFEDAWDPARPPGILLDHILFTQSVTGEPFAGAPLHVSGGAGKVEHDAHVAANAVFESGAEGTSDHRPVSLLIEQPI